MRKSKVFKNVLTGFGGQFITILLGIIVPKIFICSYGSDLNGLVSTISQIFTYLALLEAGIGQATQNALYKPIQEKDRNAINQICSSANHYFRKLTFLYGIGVLALSVLIPYTLKTQVDAEVIFVIVLLEGFSGVITFYFVETPSILISVDGKNYVNNEINLFNKIAGYIVKIVMAYIGINIVFVQLAYFFIVIVKVFFYSWYFRKKYSWVNFHCASSGLKFRDRNSYIITEVAWTIFSSTDMIVLSTFVSTQMSSVYGIYNMIFSSINVLLNAVYNSVKYLLGQAFYENREKYEKLHDAFTTIFLGIMTIFMSVCYILTNPFVTLYTKGIMDVVYVYDQLPLLFCLVQIISWSRYVGGNLTGIAGYAKQTSYISLIEAMINISLSICFVCKWGIVGVLIATVVALPLKVFWCIYISDKKVMNRSYRKSISILGINYFYFFLVVLLSNFIHPIITSYGEFLAWGGFLSILLGIVGMILNFGINRDSWIIIKKYVLKNRQNVDFV